MIAQSRYSLKGKPHMLPAVWGLVRTDKPKLENPIQLRIKLQRRNEVLRLEFTDWEAINMIEVLSGLIANTYPNPGFKRDWKE